MIVLDSSFLIAFHNANDSQHGRASQRMREFIDGRWGAGIVLEYVVLETTTVLQTRRGLASAVQAGKFLTQSKEFKVAPCSPFFADTLEFFSRQSGTKLSFTDCALAITALSQANGHILTFDEEFRKIAGLQVVGS